MSEPEPNAYRESLLRRLRLTAAIRTEKARSDFAEFVRFTKPDFRCGWFHVERCRGSATRRLDDFGVVGHSGSYRCAGVDGAITGRSCEILLCDDPFKNYLEAHSLAIRDGIWKNFTTALRTRVQDGGGILIVSTRWHLDDLCGRLLEREPDRWRVVSFPAIAAQDEEHRRQGEPLSEERYSLEALNELRAAMDEYLWSALFMQNPTRREAEC